MLRESRSSHGGYANGRHGSPFRSQKTEFFEGVNELFCKSTKLELFAPDLFGNVACQMMDRDCQPAKVDRVALVTSL